VSPDGHDAGRSRESARAGHPEPADLEAKDKTTMPVLSAAGSQIRVRDDRSAFAKAATVASVPRLFAM
jgi:hypothetical protein